MKVIEVLTGEEFLAEIVLAELADLKRDNFYFEWEKELNQRVVKLQLKSTKEILGLMSLEVFLKESFVKIRLLAVSEGNRGRNKKYDRIAGHLIAYAAQLAVYNLAEDACLVIWPKTIVAAHYKEKYKMKQVGSLLSLEVPKIIDVINTYDHD